MLNRLDVQAIAPAGVEVVMVEPRTCDLVSVDPRESALVERAPEPRRREHAAGRAGARVAMARLGVASGPLLARADGSPCWPPGTRGSISHKPGLCIVVVGRSQSTFGLGVDVEINRALPSSARSAVLTAAECAGPAGTDAHEARLVFSAKEAYYKWFASTGLKGRPGFHDIEVERTGSELSLRPVEGCGLPAIGGACVVNADWFVTLVWGEPVESS